MSSSDDNAGTDEKNIHEEPPGDPRDSYREEDTLDKEVAPNPEEKREKSDTELYISNNEAKKWVIKWASRIFIYAMATIVATVIFLFFVYAVYIGWPNCNAPKELTEFLSRVWSVLSNGAVVAALTLILPKLFNSNRKVD